MKAMHWVRFGFRHFISSGRRIRQLLRRKEREVRLEITHHSPAESSSGLDTSVVVWTIVTHNAWAIRIGEFLLPVFADETPIRITWPLAKGENRIVIEALGIAGRKSQTSIVRNDEPTLTTPVFSPQLRVKNAAWKQPAFQLKQPVFSARLPAVRLKSQTIILPAHQPTLRRTLPVLRPAGSLALPDLAADLLRELNQTNPTR